MLSRPAPRSSFIAADIPNPVQFDKQQVRLLDERQNYNKGPMFTSNFSVNEFVLGKQCELASLGQVMGNCAYCLNRSVFDNRMYTGEIKALARPLLEVYLKALYDMQQAAKQLQAHAVIGIRIEQTRKHKQLWTPKNVIEVRVTGTAVAWKDSELPENPYLAGLTGQEFYALRCAGYYPIGLVLGQSVYYQLSQDRNLFANIPTGVSLLDYERINLNMERSDYTTAINKARDLAIMRMQSEAEYLQAEGILGISIKKQVSLQGTSLLVEFLALGTAVVSSEVTDGRVDYSLSLGI
jgi:uncharacterized protein YbjQ (UPF0145 family)